MQRGQDGKGMRGGHLRFRQQRLQGRSHIAFRPLHQQALRAHAPEQIRMRESRHERFLFRRIKSGIRIIARAAGVNPIDPAVLRIAHRSLVGIALAVFRIESRVVFVRRGVVLDDEVIPIADPHRAIGAGFRRHRARPRIGRAVEVVVQLFR